MTVNRRPRPAAPATLNRTAPQASNNIPSKSAAFAPRLTRLALETRILFDGAGAAAATDALADDPFFQDIAPQSQQDEQQPNPLFEGGSYVMVDGESDGAAFGDMAYAVQELLADPPAEREGNTHNADLTNRIFRGLNDNNRPGGEQESSTDGIEAGVGDPAPISSAAHHADGGVKRESRLLSMVSHRLEMTSLGDTVSGTITKIENTADDSTVSVGEDDVDPVAVLKDWKVTGIGQITVTISGGTNGTLSHVDKDPSTFTGTADEVNNWLAGIRYQYKTTDQKQGGDTDRITLTFTTTDAEGKTQDTVEYQDILIAPQNDAPVFDKNGQTIASVPERDKNGKPGELSFGAPVLMEGRPGFSHELLGISDPDNLPEQVIIKLESVPEPEYGSLVLTRGGQTMTLAVGSTFSVAELANLRYVTTGEQVSPNDGSATTPLQTFSFTIDDGAGGRLIGQEVSIKLTPVNQAPSVSGSVVIIEGERGPNGKGVSLGLGGQLPVIGGERGTIEGVDPDDKDRTYEITGLPKFGTLYYNGEELTEANIDRIVIKDLNLLTYRYSDDHEPGSGKHGTHSKNGGEAGQDSFLIKVKDAGGGEGESAAITSESIEIKLTILDNNDDPYFDMDLPAPDEDGKITVDTLDYESAEKENGNTIVITPDMLPLKDSDSFDANLVFTIVDSNASEAGYFTVNGHLLDADGGKAATFTYQDVLAGEVEYHLFGTNTTERIDYIEFTVLDSGIGILFDEKGNARPREGGIYRGPDADAKLQVFRFEVRVPATTGGEPVPLPDLPNIADRFDIRGDKHFDIKEGAGTSGASTGYPLTRDDLFTRDGVSGEDKIVYRLETVPQSGTLYRDGVALKQFDSFTQADIDGGRVVFEHAGGEIFSDSFQFSVSNGSITTGALSTFTITVIPQNDTPSASQNQIINVSEGNKIVVGEHHIELDDSDRGDNSEGYDNKNQLWFVITELPKHGDLYWVADPDGAPDGRILITDANRSEYKITQADLAAGKLVYEHRGEERFTDSFKIRPYDDRNVFLKDGDDGYDARTGITETNHTSEGEEVTIDISITPVNDAPEIQRDEEGNITGKQELTGENALYEGQEAVIRGENPPSEPGDVHGQLIYTDSDNSKVQIQYRITKATEYGQLYKGGIVLKKGSVFTQADLDAGLIKYVHNGGEGHKDSFEYTVSDGDYRVNDEGDGADEPGSTPVSSVFNIEIRPANDSPEVTSRPSAPIVVDGKKDHVLIPAPGFSVADKDLADGVGLERDRVTVIIRVVDASGTPVTNVDYTLKMGEESSNKYLIFTGSVDQVNSALKNLEVGFGSDVKDGIYRLQMIVDDRLNPDGTAYQNGGDGVIANGGDKNQEKPLNNVDKNEYEWSTATITDATSFNLAVAYQDIWVSSVNETPELTVSGSLTVNEDVPYKITGAGWSVTDNESATFGTPLTVTISTGGYGTLEARGLPLGVSVSGNNTGELTLTGTQAALDAYLKATDDEIGVFYTTAKDVNHDVNGDAVGDVTLTVTLSEGGVVNSANPDQGGSVIGGNTGDSGSVKNDDVVQTIAVTINPVNDAPSVKQSESAPVTATSAEEPVHVPGFSVGDKDIENDGGGVTDGESNFMQVTIRLLDHKGKPLSDSDYTGVQFDFIDAAGNRVVTEGDDFAVDESWDGNGTVLQLRGTLENINTALKFLHVTLGEALSDRDQPYQVQVIADDRLRDVSSGVLQGGANGGVNNNDGRVNLDSIPGAELELAGDIPDIFNISANTRAIWPSSVNEGPEIWGSDKSVDEDISTFVGGDIIVSDKESDGFGLNVKVTLEVPYGKLTVGTATGVTVKGSGTGSVELIGTASDIQKLLNDASKGLHYQSPLNHNADVNDDGETAVRGDVTLVMKIDEYEAATEFGETPKTSEHFLYITIKPVNDAPVIGGSPHGETNGAYEIWQDLDENGERAGWHWTTGPDDADSGENQKSHAPVYLFPKQDASVSDVDLNVALNDTGATGFGGGFITVTMKDALPGDVLGIDNAKLGSGDGDLAAVGISSIDTSKAGTLVILLNDNATVENVQALLNAITYDNDGDPTDGGERLERGFTIVLNDGNNGGKSGSDHNGEPLSSNTLEGALHFVLRHPPVAEDDQANAEVSVTSPIVSGNVRDNDSDPDHETSALVVTLVKTGKDGPVGGTAFNGGDSITVEGKYGALTINKDGSYSYTLNVEGDAFQALKDQAVEDVFSYRITDPHNQSDDATLVINIQDYLPTAVDHNGGTVTEDGAPNTLSGTVWEKGSEYGKDGPAASDPLKWGAPVAKLGEELVNLEDYGTLQLQPDGTWSFRLDNDKPATQLLKENETIEVSVDYTIRDGDGDEATAKLTFQIKGADDNAGVTPPNSDISRPSHTVYEKGLVDERDTTETVTGTVKVTTTDGISEVTIGGITFELSELQDLSKVDESKKTIDTGEGVLVIQGYSSTDGDKTADISYTYTLKERQDHTAEGEDESSIDTVTVAVKGIGGSEASGDITIEIIDDVPLAADFDGGTVTEDAEEHENSGISGNVLQDTGDSTTGADGKTTYGADGEADNNAFTWNTDSLVAKLNDRDIDLSDYGTITLNNDGSWSFNLDNAKPATQALDDGDTIVVTVDYTIVDKDGDDAGGELTFSIEGKDDIAGVEAPEHTIREADLTPEGVEQLTVDGTIKVSATDGISEVTIGGITFDLSELRDFDNVDASKKTIDTSEGTLIITGYTSEDGDKTADITYTYVFNEPVQHNEATDEGEQIIDSITIVLKGVGGSIESSEIRVTIIDDVPDADDDKSHLNVADKQVSGNVFENDKIGADGFPSGNDDDPDPVTAVTGVGDKPGTWTEDGNWTVEGKYGTLILHPDGDYTYTLDSQKLIGDPASTAWDDVFTYKIRDADGDESEAKLTINIVNREPEPERDTASTRPGQPVTGNLISNDTDPDGNQEDHPLTVTEISVTVPGEPDENGDPTPGETYTVVVPEDPATEAKLKIPGYGTITVSSTGDYEFTPEPGYVGKVPPIEYTVQDPYGAKGTSTLEITVSRPQPPAPEPESEPEVPVDPEVPVEPEPEPEPEPEAEPEPELPTEPEPEPEPDDPAESEPGLPGVPTDPTQPEPEDDIRYQHPDPGVPGMPGAPGNPAGMGSTVAGATRPGIAVAPGGLFQQIGNQARSPVTGNQVEDPSVFFDGSVHSKIPRLPLPFHPIVYVNREVQSAQDERARTDVRNRADTYWSQPAEMTSRSIGAGLGQDANLFVQHAVRGSQRQGSFFDSVVAGRLGRVGLGSDGALPTPNLFERLPPQGHSTQQPAAAAEETPPQPDSGQSERPEQQAAMELTPDVLAASLVTVEGLPGEDGDVVVVSHAAPSFSEQLRGGSGRLPVVLQAPKDLS